jgi:hypothetical protein
MKPPASRIITSTSNQVRAARRRHQPEKNPSAQHAKSKLVLETRARLGRASLEPRILKPGRRDGLFTQLPGYGFSEVGGQAGKPRLVEAVAFIAAPFSVHFTTCQALRPV